MEAATAQPEEHIPPHHDSERAAFRNTHTSLGAAGHWIRTAGILAPLVIGEFVKDHEQRWQWIRIASGINLSEPFQCHSQPAINSATTKLSGCLAGAGWAKCGRRTILGWALRQAPVGNRQIRCPAPSAAKGSPHSPGQREGLFFCALALSRSDWATSLGDVQSCGRRTQHNQRL